MRELLFYKDYRNKDQFKIDYPYYGLFGSADITANKVNNEVAYTCKLLNGSVITLKRLAPRKWIDLSLEQETPLSSIIGTAIDDFLKDAKDNEQ